VSCDPLQFKQPDKQPFHYCSNNPINRVDKNGMLDDEPPKTTTDAGHGIGLKGGIIDPGAVDGTHYEKDYALKIEERVDYWLKEWNIDNTRTRESDLEVDSDKWNYNWKLANKNGSEVLVSFHLDWAKGIDNLVAVYEGNISNSVESEKLAESIINNSTILEPANKAIKTSSEYTKVKTIGVLREFKGKAGVLLELGSIGSESTRELIETRANDIGKEIATGIYQYLFNGDSPPTKEDKMLMDFKIEPILMPVDNVRVVIPQQYNLFKK
jgi:N-acetylmuramoyl-L-alanine amidase